MIKILKRSSENIIYSVKKSLDDLVFSKDCNQQRFITSKKINMIDYINCFTDKKRPPDELIISNSAIDKRAVSFFKGYAESNTKTDIFIQINSTEKDRKPEIIDSFLSLDGGNIHTGLKRVHAKIILIRVENEFYSLEGSGNVSTNAEIEQYCLTTGKETFDFHKKWITEKTTIKPKKQTIIAALPAPDEKEKEDPDQTVEDIPPKGKRQRRQKRTNTAPDYSDMDELITESQKAALMKPILDNTLKERKIEQETLELKKKAGDVMEFGFGDFVFFSHIERIHIEIARMGKKLRPLLDGPVKEQDLLEVIRIIEKECTSILVDVKKGQAEAVKSWEDEF